MISIYLDVCCLNRPFDDQSQDRVRLETAAVLTVLRRVEQGVWFSISSTAVRIEINNDTDGERRAETTNFDRLAQRTMAVGQDQASRALELQKLGFGAFDAVHVACAEHAGVDVLLTVDDRFLRLSDRLRDSLAVRVANPVVWPLEVM